MNWQLLRTIAIALGFCCLPFSAIAQPKPPAGNPPRTLGNLIDPAAKPGEFPPPPRIDDVKAKQAGLRKLVGKYVTIYTDVPSAAEVDELPKVFDAAVPQWCEYFGVDPKLTANWHLVAYLAADKTNLTAFTSADLWPATLPPFLNGYQSGAEFWEYDQPSAYYRRHLMLHEGTHAFLFHFRGGSGAPWFNEGVAELLGTHLWKDGKLKLNVMPAHRDDVPYWGRVKILKDYYAAGKALKPFEVMQLKPGAFLETDSYGWSWAAAYFFDHHPLTSASFRKLQENVDDRTIDFSKGFYDELQQQWPAIEDDWQIFIADADYGYDVARAAVVRLPAEVLPVGGKKVKIKADRGWQSTGVRFEPNVKYELKASGRYQIGQSMVDQKPQPWWCEPNGVTIHYHKGEPLGLLIGTLGDWDQPPPRLPFLSSAVVGLQMSLKPPRAGTLYLKINEPASGLADNVGELEVEIRKVE